MSTIRVNLLVAGLTDVGYRFYTQNTPVGARVTAGILDEGDGWYSKAGVTLAGDHVRWDSTGTAEAVAREDLAIRLALASLALASGAGAFAVTVTVKDADYIPLENASVRMTEGINSLTAKTDADGIATFNLDPATYAVAITKPGYSFAGDTAVVTAAANFDFAVDQIVIPAPADPALSTGYLTTRNAQGAAQGSVTIHFQLVTAPGVVDSYKTAVFEVTSDEAGALTVDLVREATYRARRDFSFNLKETDKRSPWVDITVPDSGSFALPLVLGQA